MKQIVGAPPIRVFFGTPGNWKEAEGVTIKSIVLTPKPLPIRIKDLYPNWQEPRYFRYMRWILRKRKGRR